MSSCSYRQEAGLFAGSWSSCLRRPHPTHNAGFFHPARSHGNLRSLFAAPPFSDFHRVRRDDIVHLMSGNCAVRARFTVAILSLALLYASTCWATCAICLRAGTTPVTQNHDCDHAASNMPGGSHQQHPATPDCYGHHHASFELLQADGLAQLHFSATNHAHVNQFAANAVNAETFGVAASSLSDLAPPPQLATISPQQKASILRI
jgi:hypothetical protein